MAVMPTNVLLFMSDIAPLVTAITGAPSLSGTFASLFVVIVRLLPSRRAQGVREGLAAAQSQAVEDARTRHQAELTKRSEVALGA